MDPDDPTVIAENELLGAAKSIEAAAKKLMQLKPRASARVSLCLSVSPSASLRPRLSLRL